MDLSDSQLLRYGRQIMLPALGIEGQEQLLASRVLLVGLGGLGSPAAMYLAACGVGHLTLADSDQVELVNLQRQILYDTEDLNKLKTDAAQQALHSLNPEIELQVIPKRLDAEQLEEHVQHVDLVMDTTDNFETRLAINEACVRSGKPLVSGAVIRTEGQLMVFRNRQKGDACYQCLFGNTPVSDVGCAELGILGPVAGVVGSMQAIEAIKCLTDLGTPLYNRLMLYDAALAQWRTIELVADPHCPTCGNHYT